MAQNYQDFVNLSIGEIQKKFSVEIIDGLTAKKANTKLITEGYNILQKQSKKSLLLILFEQFTNGLVALLILALIISLSLQRIEDAVFIT